jgi:hypothetical protein
MKADYAVVMLGAACVSTVVLAMSDVRSFAKSAAPVEGKNSIEYFVPGDVPKLTQPNARACWATAAAMMLQWQAVKLMIGGNIRFSPEDAARLADKNRGDTVETERSFTTLLNEGRGLSDIDKPTFLKSLGLKAEWPANYTVEGWLNLLKTYGILWVTTEAAQDGQAFVHAQIVTGLVGDGSYSGTFMVFIDPLDGKEHRETLVKFISRYESVIIKDTEAAPDLEPRFQVLHFGHLDR